MERPSELFCKNWHKVRPVLEIIAAVSKRKVVRLAVELVIVTGDKLKEEFCKSQ